MTTGNASTDNSTDDGTISDVAAYFAAQPEPQRSTLLAVRAHILAILPEAEECLSYSMPGYRVRGKMIAGIAGYKNHVSFFPHSGKVLPVVAEHLTGYEWATGTLRFPVDQPLPEALVRVLIDERMTQAFPLD